MIEDVEIMLDILPTGEIRFPRERREECRSLLLEILTDIVDKDEKKVEEIKRFLSGADDIDLILGNEVLCG